MNATMKTQEYIDKNILHYNNNPSFVESDIEKSSISEFLQTMCTAYMNLQYLLLNTVDHIIILTCIHSIVRT